MARPTAPLFAQPRADSRVRPADLLAGVREGSTGALQSLVDLHWRPLLGFAFRILGCADAAEDVVQRAFIRFWEKRESWQPGSDPKLILYTVVRNLGLNQLESDRARQRRRNSPRAVPAQVADPGQILDESELRRAMEAALARLSPRRREALVLARFHDLSHAEIAEVMGLAQRTVTNHISVALAELEGAVGRYLEGE